RGYGGVFFNVTVNLLLGRLYYDKEVQGRIIPRGKLDLGIASPGVLTNGPKMNAYLAVVCPRDPASGVVSRAGAAEVFRQTIEDDAFLRKTPVLTSWRDLRG